MAVLLLAIPFCLKLVYIIQVSKFKKKNKTKCFAVTNETISKNAPNVENNGTFCFIFDVIA